MQPGQLQHKCELQRPEAGTDALGQPLTGWTSVGYVWADVRHTTGLEAIKADALQPINRASVRIHWRPDVTAAWRLIHQGRAYDIRSVLPDPSGRAYLDLVCEAR